MREAEVLRDYLLRRFAEDPTLRPRDAVVMMPDPEGYALITGGKQPSAGWRRGCPNPFLFQSWTESQGGKANWSIAFSIFWNFSTDGLPTGR